MEPEVHIIEKYFQEVLHCFTMTNVRCKGRKEIDLLAINPMTGEKYHVEARVSTLHAFGLRTRDLSSHKRSYRRGLDYFVKEKFGHPAVVERISELFGSDNYLKVLVVFHVDKRRFDAWDADEVGVKIWLITDLIETLMRQQKTRGSRDDIMRTLELMYTKRIYDTKIRKREEIEAREFLRIRCKTCCHINKIKVITNYVRWIPEPHETVILAIYEATETSNCEKCGSTVAESKHRFILNPRVPMEWIEKYAKKTQSKVFKLQLIESSIQKDDFESERVKFWVNYLYGSDAEKS